MKERPILFSGEMVLAIMDGRKSQTRRVIKPQPFSTPDGSWHIEMKPRSGYSREGVLRSHLPWRCPYGEPGDRLWVKETFGVHDTIITLPSDLPNFKDQEGIHHPVVLFAGKENYAWGMYGPPRKRSGRFMPKSVTRIWLEIVKVRVEMVKEISEADAIAEGVDLHEAFDIVSTEAKRHLLKGNLAIDRYARLWDSINGDGAWDLNPWVWVIEFKDISLTLPSPAGRGKEEPVVCSQGYDMGGV
jgi:hypothetical protein